MFRPLFHSIATIPEDVKRVVDQENRVGRTTLLGSLDRLIVWGERIGGSRDYLDRLTLLRRARDADGAVVADYLEAGILPSLAHGSVHGLTDWQIAQRRRHGRARQGFDPDRVVDAGTAINLAALLRSE